ncbi:uncharacterized protein [Branchiostoma lanceolatum]|uniref:uncharacterized protein n=1 Tax=Branchiostoma lanceolatum TaxID=7740 RepID=UPI00345403A1
MPPTPETCGKARSSQLSSHKKGCKVQKAPTGQQSTVKVRKCSLRLRNQESSQTKKPEGFSEVLKSMAEDVRRGSSKGESLTEGAKGLDQTDRSSELTKISRTGNRKDNKQDHVTNNRTTQVSSHGKFAAVDSRQRTLRNSLKVGPSNKEKPDMCQEKTSIRNGQLKSSSSGTSLEGNLANHRTEPKKVPKARTKSLLSMRVALTDVELGSTEDNTLFKTGVERKKDPPSSPGYTVVNAPKNRNTNVKGAFPYTGIGRPSKHNIPTVSITPGLNSSVSHTIAKDKDGNKANGMEVQTCKIAKLRGNGSAIEWIQVDLTEASINDYIKSKKAKLAEDEKAAYGGRKKEKTYYVTGNVVETSVRQGCNKKVVPKNASKTNHSSKTVHVSENVGNSRNRNKQSVFKVVPDDNKKARQQTVVMTPKKMFSCIHTDCTFSTDYESRLKRHLRSHGSATANATDCPQYDPKEKTLHQTNTLADDIDTTVETITLDDEIKSKPNNCEGQKVMHKKEQGQTSVREAHIKEPHPEVRGQQQGIGEMEGKPENNQQRDNEKEKHLERVVQALEEDEVNSKVEQVPLQNSGKENHSETVLQAIEQDQVKDEVKVMSVIHEQETSGKKTNSETTVEKQHQLKVQKESVVSQKEIPTIETDSEIVQQVEQQQTTLEDDDNAVINQQETAGTETDSEKVAQDKHQQQKMLEEDSTVVEKQQESTRKEHHSEKVVQDRQQQQVALEEDDIDVVNQQGSTVKETDSEAVEQVMQQQQTTLKDDYSAVTNQQETAGNKTDSETVVQDRQQQQQMMLEEDITAVKKQQEPAGNQTDSEIVVQDRQQQQVALEEDDTAAVVNQQETARNESDLETVVQVRQQQQVALEEDDIDVVYQQGSTAEETDSETVVQVRQQQQVALEEDDIDVVYQQGSTAEETDSETVVQDRQQQQVALEEDDTAAVVNQQETARNESDLETVVQVRQQQQVALEEDDIDVVYQQGSTAEETDSETVVQVRQQQQVALEEDDIDVVYQQGSTAEETDSETVVQDRQQQQVALEEDDAAAVVNQQETARNENESETVVQVRQQQQIMLEEDDTAVNEQQETVRKETDSEKDVHLRQQQQVALGEDDIAAVDQQETTGKETDSEAVEQVKQQQQIMLEEDGTAVINQQETNGRETDSETFVQDKQQQQQMMLEEDITAVKKQQEPAGKEHHSETVVQDRQQQQVALEEGDTAAVVNQQEITGKETDSEKVVQDRQQQQIMLEEDDTAVINRQETNREETDPKTSAEDTEPIKVVSEDKDIPVIHQLETIKEEDNSEMAVGDHQEVEEDKDVPVVSQQETDIADPSLEVPLECDGQTDSADRVGCVTDDDSEATDVYSFTEDNSTHGMDVELGTMKTFPDPVQQHSVTVGQVQSTDVGQFVQTSTDTNITVPDDQSDEECQDAETASVEASSTATDTSQGETVMTEVSHVEGRSQEDTMMKETPSLGGTKSSRDDTITGEATSLISENNTISGGTSPLAVPNVPEDVAELTQVSQSSHTDISQESGEASPFTSLDISKTQGVIEEAPPQQITDDNKEDKTPSLTVLRQADTVLGESPPDSTLEGEASSPEVVDVSQKEERNQKELSQTLHPQRPNGVQILNSVTKLAYPMLEQINIPKKRRRGRHRKIKRPMLPAKDDGAKDKELACPMQGEENTQEKQDPGGPRKRRKVQDPILPGEDSITEVSCPVQEPIVIPPKRGRGRPRKVHVGLPAKEGPVFPAKDYPIRSRVIKKRGRGRPRKYPHPGEHSHVPCTNKHNIPHINQQLEALSRKRKKEEDLHNECPPAKRRRLRPRQSDKIRLCPTVEMNQATPSVQQGCEQSVCLDSTDPGILSSRSTAVAPKGKQGHDRLCEEGNKEMPISAHGDEDRLARMHKEQPTVGTCHLVKRRRGRPPKNMGKFASTSNKGQNTLTLDPLQVVPLKYTLSVDLTRINHQMEGHLNPTDYAKNKTWNNVSEKKRKARELIARSLRLRNHKRSSGRKEADAESVLRLQSLRQTEGRKEVTVPIEKETPKKKSKSPLKCRYSMALLSCSQCDFATIEEKKMEQHCEKTGHMAASSASLGEIEQKKPNANGRVYKCSNCSYKNKKKSQVLRHKARCDKNIVRVLRQVPQSSKEKDIQSSKGMKKYSQSHYDPLSKIYLSCNQCPFKTFRKNNLRIHKEHHDPRCKHRKHTCQLCSYGCNGKDDFQKHLQLHKQDRAITVEPAVSGTAEQIPLTAEQTNVIENETTGDGDALVGNSDVSDDEEDDVKMKCPHCPFETHVPLSLELHVKHHKDICPHNQLQCKFCTFFCKTQTHMTRHVKLHKVAAEPLREENHLNNICDVEKQAFYAYDFDLNQENCPEKIGVHSTVTKQTEVKEQHVCGKCTVVFRSRYRLLIHKIQHETGTYLRCEECKFRTKKQKKYQFLAHLNAHFNMKPYKCKFCPYRAGCYSTVFKHILKSHNTKHSRYRCNKCSFSCKGLGWLKRHQKLHLQGQVVPMEGNKYGKYDIEVENIIVCGKYKQKKMDGQDEAMRTTDGVSSTAMVSPQKHAGISCVREVQNTTDGSVEFWFLCRFCGKMHVDQESWFAHVQRHIISSAWHPKNALSSQPAQREETYPTIGSPRGMLCPGEESESRQQHVVMEKHSDTDCQSEDALDTAEEYNYAGIQGNVDATASQKCDDGKEWSRENSLKEDLEETADCSASLEGSREEDADVTGNQLLRNRLNSTDSTVACLQDSNPCGSGSTLDTDDDSDLPPLLKTTNELELAFVFPPDKQAELIREQLAQHETASIGSEDNPVPSLQEIEPEGHEEPTYLPHCDNGSSASCSGSMLGSSDDRLSSVGNLMSEQREEETGTDLSAWISALQYDQTSEVEGAICATVPGLPPGKTIRCQFCGLQFDSQLTFLQHKMRHLQ